MSSGLFDLLPIELIEKILSFLSEPHDLTSAARLNGSIYKIIKDSVEIQYVLNLMAHGMIDGDKSGSALEKLTELLRMEEAWKTLDLSRRVSVKVPHHPSHIYDLSGGVYLLGDCEQVTGTRETRSLRFYDLTRHRDGPVTGIREETWREMSIPDTIVDVGLAVQELDLIGIVGVRELQHDREDGEAITLHLRQFSTGLPHPYADMPVVSVGRSEYAGSKLLIVMEIVGPSLMLLLLWPLSRVADRKDVLLLVNWWTGEIVIREEVLRRTYAGFVFLMPNLVLLPNSRAGTLEVVQLPDLTNIGNTTFDMFKRIARLSLPRMNANCHVFNITCRADPNPLGVPHPKQDDIRAWQKSRERTFSTDPSRSLILMRILIRENERRLHPWLHYRMHWYRINLLVHRDALLKAIRSQAGPQNRVPSAINHGNIQEGPAKIVPWMQWAPGIVRWCAGGVDRSLRITTTSGQRFVSLDTYKRLVVKDFNLHAVARLRATLQPSRQLGELEMSDSTRTRIVERNTSPSENLECLETVFSSDDMTIEEMPYVETISDLSSMGLVYDRVLLDEERIIGLMQDSETDAAVKFDVISM